MSKLLRGSKGFTLIELMIVILIIAILVAIAVPVYLNARKNAQRRTCQSNLRTSDGAIQSYQAFFDDARYPDSMGSMLSSATKVLKSCPFCPTAGSPTSYIWVTGTPPTISCPSTESSHTI